MAELLIIIGVSGFIISTLGLMHEAASRGHSALFFLVPLASLGQVQQHWEEYRWWALGRVASLLTAAVGVALFLATGQTLLEPSTRQNLAGQAGQGLRGDNMASSTSFVTSEKAALLVVEGQGKALSGRLHGQRFRYDRVALIDGVLTASQGEGFLPELEVRILLGWNPQDITERRSLLVNPSDEEAPVVHLSWKPDGQDYPETLIFSGGYRLELALAPLDTGQLSGSMVLVMPDSFKSYLVGDFTAYSNHLRYRNGEVDLHFDHDDTLAHVAEEYLVTQFPEGLLESVKAEHVQLRRAEASGQVMARVVLTNGAVEQRHVRLEKSEVGWAVVPGSMETRVITPPSEGGATLVTPTFEKAAPEQPKAQPPVEKTFPELIAYVDKKVLLETQSGRQLDGVLRRVSGNRLWLVMNVGSGNVERSVSDEELKSVTLSNGQRIDLISESDTDSEVVIAPDNEAAPVQPERLQQEPQPEEAISAKLRELRALVGKSVTITAAGVATRTGILQAVSEDHLTLSVAMGAGNIEYFYDMNSIQKVEAVR